VRLRYSIVDETAGFLPETAAEVEESLVVGLEAFQDGG